MKASRYVSLACVVLATCVSRVNANPGSNGAKPVICLDPGHPSEINDGYQKQNGTTETHVCWVIAQRLRALLSKDGYRVVLTKLRENQLVRNVRRAQIANRSRARLMLRLHCDTGSGTGFRLFYPDTTARDGKVTGPSVEVQIASHTAAECLRRELASGLGDRLKDNGVATDRATAIGRKYGGTLIGSIHSKAPVVLVEMVFLNNPKNAEFIKSVEGQDVFARALASGIRAYVPLTNR